jgi:hypothetical protein
MDWLQFFGLLVTIGTLFLWSRGESNADRREIMSILREMKDEMKDFHGRLCAIEEKNKKQ